MPGWISVINDAVGSCPRGVQKPRRSCGPAQKFIRQPRANLAIPAQTSSAQSARLNGLVCGNTILQDGWLCIGNLLQLFEIIFLLPYHHLSRVDLQKKRFFSEKSVTNCCGAEGAAETFFFRPLVFLYSNSFQEKKAAYWGEKTCLRNKNRRT